MESWYKVVTPRKEVREGRSFNPDEFAIALDQVVTGKGPEDYRDPAQFFSRTYFTRALTDYAGMVLKRLEGETANTAPVLTLITQFGGGKTHTLTALYHMANAGETADAYTGVSELIKRAGLKTVPHARVAVFVGNAWDPQEGKETPWIDVARQLAGEKGLAALGTAVKKSPPGTEAMGKVFEAAGEPVLVLFDEVLNFVNRHRGMAEHFHAFLQNLTVAMTGTTHGAAVISLPRSQVEMTDWDHQWQEKITKVVRRVAKDLISNDETEISEVVRRRLFQDLGKDRARKQVAKAFADWCFERRAQLPAECFFNDTATSESKAKEALQARFEACYPFHPATLSVFQRKWQTLPQYQQTRGTLAMLAQWISWAYRDGFTHARKEPLITIGSAPLEVSEFRSVVLGQLGESRLIAAIDADIAGSQAHCRALDADTKGPLRSIHQRVGTTILFESSGGQVDKVAHLPELRFAIGGPEVDTTSVDTSALTLESKAYYIRKVGSDGFRIHHKPTLKKVVSDRKASLDEDKETKPEIQKLVKNEFEKGRSTPIVYFPSDGSEVQDSPRLSLIILNPDNEWTTGGALQTTLSEWMKQRGTSPRLYPGSLVWCVKKKGRELQEKTEKWLAWRRVKKDIDDGVLGGDFEKGDLSDIRTHVTDAEVETKDEVWASYRFIVLADAKELDGLKVIDLGAGHSSANETLCGRVISALKSQALLNESVGAGYIERNWPPALKAAGAWPLPSLRQSFLNGSLTRLLDPDAVLRAKLPEFVSKGDFGLGSDQNPDGSFQRVWYGELLPQDEVSFEPGVFLLAKERAKALKVQPGPPEGVTIAVPPQPTPQPVPTVLPQPTPTPGAAPAPQTVTLRLTGTIPPELWNRLGTKVIPKMKAGSEFKVVVDFSVVVETPNAQVLELDLQQMIQDLGLKGQVRLVKS